MMEKYAALLWAPWNISKDENGDAYSIKGFWAEDGSPYDIECPIQLADLLVDLQNALSCKYSELKRAEYDLAKLTDNMSKMFK
jgi:hypothetical protein